MIDRIRLQVAGIVALANAILTLPTIVLMFVIGGNESQAAGLLVAALELIGAAMGVKLLRSEASLFGLRVPVASLHICTGVSFLSLICMPLGILSSMVSDLVLCVLFFRAARPPSVA
jgi:hypothetical protein